MKNVIDKNQSKRTCDIERFRDVMGEANTRGWAIFGMECDRSTDEANAQNFKE